jgi:hypothetical protein
VFEKFDVGNSVIFNLSIGMLVSIWFYFLVVHLPSAARKRRIKRNFIFQYIEFRRKLIYHIIGNSGEAYSHALIDELMGVKEFRDYFNTKINETQNRWFAFSNNISNESLSDILLEFEAFQEAITILLINIDIQNENVFSFLHRLKTISITQKNARVEDYNSFRFLRRLLWEMLAGFSQDDYRDFDYFEEMFRKI